jgi:hypothetical protein
MDWALKSLTLIAAAVFALWALYISLVEHPARLAAPVAAALAQFRESYRRAAPWQASFAAIALAAGVLASVATREWIWAMAGVLVGAAIPFTLLVIMPTNRVLLHGAPADEEAAVLLARWGRLHWVRSLLGLGALLLIASKLRLG